MMGSLRSAGLRRTVATASAGLLAMAGVMATTGTASADTVLKVNYPVTGSTTIASTNSSITLGPGTLASKADLTSNTLTAKLKLPKATSSFNALGLVPVTATVQFINDGPTTGTIDPNTGAVATTSTITLKLSNVTAAGIPVSVGNSCETSTPITVAVTSDAGFSIIAGGNLSGTYTIPQFANCGLSTLLLNLLIPGSGNSITLTLGPAKRV